MVKERVSGNYILYVWLIVNETLDSLLLIGTGYRSKQFVDVRRPQSSRNTKQR